MMSLPPSENKSVSIVAAVRNRQKHLFESLKTWQELPEVDEIIIVDYGSAPPTDPAITKKSHKIKLYRVDGSTIWKNGSALNIGIQFAKNDLILKIDCDVNKINSLSKYVGNIRADSFYVGWDGEQLWNGQCLIFKAQWQKVGGYHGFMTGWGYDDVDFYKRLARKGFKANFFEVGDIEDMKHSDALRTEAKIPTYFFTSGKLNADKVFQGERNRMMSKIFPWRGQGAIRHESTESEKNYYRVVLKRESFLEKIVMFCSTLLCTIKYCLDRPRR